MNLNYECKYSLLANLGKYLQIFEMGPNRPILILIGIILCIVHLSAESRFLLCANLIISGKIIIL